MARKSRKNINPENEICSDFDLYNTAIYIRLSVEDNKKRGNSIETQKSIIENFIALNTELRAYDIYIDNGTTGTNFERHEFKRMIRDIENKKVNCVIVKDLSRLGRNAIDTGFYVEKYFPLNHIRFISVNDGFDTNDSNNHMGIILPLKNMINEAYSIDIGRKIKAQAHQSMIAGEYIGGRPPYGYLKSPDNCHKLIVDEETAPIVRQIFQWAYEKIGYNEIVKWLNEANIMPPSQYAYSKGIITHQNLLGKGKWQTRTIQKLLSSECYMGDMVQGKSKSVNHKQIPVSEENWITVRDTHEPIVSREIFEVVKVHFQQVAEKSKNTIVDPYTANIFKSKVFCGHCGRPMHRTRSHNVAYVFRCLANDRIAKNTCLPVSVTEKNLIETTYITIQKQAIVILGKHLTLLQNEKNNANKKISEKQNISALKHDIENNKRFLKSLYENLVKDIITNEEYFSMKAEYETKITSALSKISEFEKSQNEREHQLEYYRDLSNSIDGIGKNTELTAELIDKLIDRILIYSDKSIEINFRFQDEFEKSMGAGRAKALLAYATEVHANG